MADDLDDLEPVLHRAGTVLRAMAYEHRLRILVALRGGEHTVTALLRKVPADATAVSHHLRHLFDARLVRRERRGQQVVYTLAGDETRRLIEETLRHAGHAE
jgi:DNA-binding transcriptional ArsR family regulator